MTAGTTVIIELLGGVAILLWGVRMGWDVRSLKTEDGCYEVYAVDAKGSKIEAHFNPKTLERVGSDKEDEG